MLDLTPRLLLLAVVLLPGTGGAAESVPQWQFETGG
jgi:hypothetical protein